ncbi:MAG: hypothetical protein RSG55_07785, partial [Oscillospiraceae bacterium]
MKNLHKFLRPRASAEDVATPLNEFGACPATLNAEPKRSCTLEKKYGHNLGGVADEEIRKICIGCLEAYLNEEVRDGEI